jgi:hypothetical protein
MLAELQTTTEYGLPEGYTLRGATLDDLPEAVEMFNACSRQLIGTDEVTLEGESYVENHYPLYLDDRGW